MSEDIQTAYLAKILAMLRQAEEVLTTDQYLELLDTLHDAVADSEDSVLSGDTR